MKEEKCFEKEIELALALSIIWNPWTYSRDSSFDFFWVYKFILMFLTEVLIMLCEVVQEI